MSNNTSLSHTYFTPLIQFFSVSFLNKIIDLSWSGNPLPLIGEVPFSFDPPSNSLISPFQTLEGIFKLTQRPSGTLDSPCLLFPEIQRNKDTINQVWFRGGSRTSQKKAGANLDCVFNENTLFYTDP